MFGWFGKKKKEDEIMQLLKSGDSTIMAAIAKSQEELLNKFRVALLKVSTDLLDTQDRLAEINQAIETQKPIYSLKANVFVRKKSNSLKITASFNSIEALNKVFAMLRGEEESPVITTDKIANNVGIANRGGFEHQRIGRDENC